jgi:hypothetical protein
MPVYTFVPMSFVLSACRKKMANAGMKMAVVSPITWRLDIIATLPLVRSPRPRTDIRMSQATTGSLGGYQVDGEFNE